MNDGAILAARETLRYWVAHVGAQQRGGEGPGTAQGVVQRALAALVGTTGTTFDLHGPLTAIFQRIGLSDSQAPAAQPALFVRRGQLALDRQTLFPTRDAQDVAHGPDPLDLLQAEAARLRQQDLPPHTEVESLLYAFQRYAWCLPSPLAAVSLYDFARTHAALAAALAQDRGAPFLLGGDVSGVQAFIYTLTAAGAAKQLRARSFYLQLLTEAVAHYVLTRAGVPLTNLLYSGGGRFYVLLPGINHEQLQDLRREVGVRMLHRHGNALFVALGGAPYPLDGDGSAAWEAATRSLDEDKRRRFAALDPDTFEELLFTPRQPALPTDVTDATALVPRDPLSESLEQLTPRLHNTAYLLVRPVRPAVGAGERPAGVESSFWYSVLREFGLFVKPLRSLAEVRSAARGERLLELTGQDALAEVRVQFGPHGAVGTRYTVNVAPRAGPQDVEQYAARGLERDDGQMLRQGDVKPFGLLAAQSKGIERLGVLRMDVDDLGDLFGRRLVRAQGIAGLAYTAALSATLSRFFEGWVGALCRQINAGSPTGSVYAVYSGGDDLFIVGSWHLLPGLAALIREDFVRYTTGLDAQDTAAPPITISAGITLHPAKFPLYQAADEAREALEKAKDHNRSGRGKDALHLLGHTIGWEEYRDVANTRERLVQLVEGGAPRALLMTLQSLYSRAQAAGKRYNRVGEQQFAYGPWVWQGAYSLTRLAERSGALRKEVEQLRDAIIGDTTGQVIARAGLAARWAQLLMRRERT